MAGISTHVLNSGTGRPGAGMRIDFSVRDGDGWKLVKTVTTNADGRTDQPVLAPDAARTGQYELLFHVGGYYGDKSFLDRVPVRFRIKDVLEEPLLIHGIGDSRGAGFQLSDV